MNNINSINKGYFYNNLMKKREDEDLLRKCIEETVINLMNLDTSALNPGILLGKVQSGKTRAFLGVIALSFDNNYDIAIILTKGTKPLTEQTLKRLHEDFGQFEDDNKVQIHDIMSFPKNMVPYELNQKLIIVAKKEVNNLKNVISTLTTTYPDLRRKKILIIDDEADFASISFHKEKETGIVEQGKIATQIDEIRIKSEQADLLQVTATPYSLYLQPDNKDGDSLLFPPKRPSFTVLVPIHKDYVGGDYYFIDSENEGTTAYYVYNEVPQNELEILKANKTIKRADRRSFKIEDVFSSSHLQSMRESIMNFIVGGCIRRLQQKELGLKQESYSFIIHTEQSRISHDWQEEIVNKLNNELIRLAKDNSDLLSNLIELAYQNLKPSIELSGMKIPSLVDVINEVNETITQEMLVIEKVNCDKDVKALLDNKGQLKLRTPLNIFIGGQILDRGITIKNIIGFYYGRNPKTFQQDTVLQHSRMYGARSKEDLSVTRFYTTRTIYEIMKKIHEFDNALREAFNNGSHDKGVYFIRKDFNGKISPCSPNKIMLSNITTIKPFKRLLPIGFQTGFKSNIKNNLEKIDNIIIELEKQYKNENILISIEQALYILDEIEKTMIFNEEGYYSNFKEHKASLEHLSKNSSSNSYRDKVWVLIRRDRNISRIKPSDKIFSYTPDNPEIDQKPAKDLAIDIPTLILIRENGKEEDGWRGSPFWWPVIIAPQNTHITIFASDIK